MPEALRPLVQQQLEAAATQRMLWHGEVWPRQSMDLEIERNTEREADGSGDEDSRWRTTLSLTTPRLGHIEANLQLTLKGVRIALTTPDGASAVDLREAARRNLPQRLRRRAYRCWHSRLTKQMNNLPDKDARSLAVALKYAPGDAAPKIVAKGRGLIAEEIIARAKAHGVYVHESPELVTLLSQVDLDDHIPPTLYIAIAELLAWLYRVEQKAPTP